MCKQDAYNQLRLKYLTDIQNISVRIFFEQNKKFCDEHEITLAALQKKITREAWGKDVVQDKIDDVQEGREVVQEVVDSPKEDYDLLIEELNPMQEKFCQELVDDINGHQTKAAIKAGYSPESAYSQASRLLKNVKVKAYIDALRAQKRKEFKAERKLTADSIVDSIIEIRERCTQKVPVMTWDKEGKQYVQKTDEKTGEGVWQFESASALKANDMLMKHVGGYDADNRQKATVIMSDAQFKELCNNSKGVPVGDLLGDLD